MHKRAFIRALFNYPPRGQQLRSTAWLDGLRGLAALEVFVFHYCDGWIDRSIHWGDGYHGRRRWYYLPFIRTIFTSGDAAVCLFFIISGYVLSRGLLVLMRSGQHEQLLVKLSSAVVRRAIRLYTPVLFLTTVLMILGRIGFTKAAMYADQPTFLYEIWMWALSFDWLLLPLQASCHLERAINRYDGGISWTIPVEYDGSLQVYLAILFLCRIRDIRLRTTLSMLWVVIRMSRYDWATSLFIGGLTFADWHLEREARERSKAAREVQKGRPIALILLFTFGIYLAGLPPVYRTDDWGIEGRDFYDWIIAPFSIVYEWETGPERFLACIAAVCLFVSVNELKPLKQFTETRFVQYLGKISFGLYLCHIFLRNWMLPWKIASLRMWEIDPQNQHFSTRTRQFGAYVTFMVPATLIVFMVGGLFARTIDKHSIALGRRFEEYCLAYGSEKPAETTQTLPMQERLA